MNLKKSGESVQKKLHSSSKITLINEKMFFHTIFVV
jgi:hypothetical protein